MVVPPEALAHDALTRLSQADPEATCRRLGAEVDCTAVQGTLDHLRKVMADEPRPDQALALLRQRVVADWPTPSPQRRAAFLTLMMARGTARQHLPLGFDAGILDDLE